jgi:demethylmenaquinone methyltransferase / 2-methoxy-6-polyprenyl-1,4-benzoquinol methylase
MTLGQDRSWRREAARLAAPAGGRILDVGTGTGDLALAVLDAGARQVVGLDFVDAMLVVARRKAARAGHARDLALVQGDALHLPFADRAFDGVVNGFLLRNVEDVPTFFREAARVTKPGGRLVCLEITHPPRGIAPLFHLYFDRLVPIVGTLVTGEGAAYRYLPASLGPLPDVDALARLVRAAGFGNVRFRRLGFGLVAVHVGYRLGSNDVPSEGSPTRGAM